jgi:hypothetical protein
LPLAQGLETQFLSDLKLSKEFQRRRWNRRAIWKKIVEKLGSFLGPQL